MGSGASSGIAAAVATSSPEDLESALSGLSSSSKQKLMTALKSAWEERFAVIGCLSVKDLDAATKIVDTDAQTQVKEESRAPFFTVMGTATPTTDGYVVPPDMMTNGKLAWLAMFNDNTSYHDGEHATRTSKVFMPALTSVMLTGDTSDYNGGFRGECFHLEKKSSHTMSPYSIFSVAKAKNADVAKKIVQLKRDFCSKQDFDAVRITIFPPGGDIPPQYRDEVTVRWIEQWESLGDLEAYKKSPHFSESTVGITELCDEIFSVEYANTSHYSKPTPP